LNDENRLGFIHKFIPSENVKDCNSTVTLLLLHGTGGDENDLIPLAMTLEITTASILSVRGKVIENGMPRFFRRLAEGVFDIEDLKFRTFELANFIQNAAKRYAFGLNRVTVIGYSNGANIAASLLLLRPEILSNAILFRPMIPLVPDTLPDLSDKHILISAGLHDPIILRHQTTDLFDLLSNAGAKISIQWQNSGHELTQRESLAVKEWVASELQL
jgi:predicted esterase